MDKNELLKHLICEIDLVMHDKDYRFENEDGTWYSRESCKNLTNEEVFEELKSELRQLAKIEDDFADLEAKLAESDETIRLLKMSNDALREDNLDLSYNQVNNVYETATEMSKGWESQYQEEIAQLKLQLAEKENRIAELKEELDDKNFCKEFADLYNENKILRAGLQEEQNQTAIAVLEEMLDNEVYINSKLDFEDGNYVLSKIIITKIEELRNGRN